MIHAVHHPAGQMLNVWTVSAPVFLNIMAMLIQDVVQNVYLIQIVHAIRLVLEVNVLIHVLEPVVKMRFVKLLTISLCVAARMLWKEMHLFNVDQYKV